jgi:hypothetical protein
MLEQRIPQHGAKRWRHRESQPDRNTLGVEASKNLQKGDIGLNDTLEQPILLVKLIVLGMSDEGEMRVEEESQ